MLCQTGQLAGAIRIPDTVGQLVVTADLRAGKVTCHVDLDAPREGRPTTRVNWLVRQLKNAPDTARVECFTAHSRGSSAAELLAHRPREPGQPGHRPDPGDPHLPRRRSPAPLGTKRGRGRGAFIDSVLAGGRHLLRRGPAGPQGVVRRAAEAAPRDPSRHRRRSRPDPPA